MKLISIGFGNAVAAARILAVVSPDSAPIKRVVQLARERGMLLDAFGAEVLGDGPQEGDQGVGERLHAFDGRLVAVAVEAVGQQDHPFDFDAHARAVQRRRAQIFDERCGLLVVASVERGQCNCGGDVSKLHSIPDYFQP